MTDRQCWRICTLLWCIIKILLLKHRTDTMRRSEWIAELDQIQFQADNAAEKR